MERSDFPSFVEVSRAATVARATLTAQGYVEKFRDRSEMTELKEKRDEVAKELGYMCFVEYSGRYRFRVEFLKSDEFKKLMAQVRELDKEIIRIGKKLDAQTS
jgi:hypothetical protein